MPRSMLMLAAAIAAVLVALAPPAAARAAVAVGTFDGGSGSFLTTPSGTDGLRRLDGRLTFRQSGRAPAPAPRRRIPARTGFPPRRLGSGTQVVRPGTYPSSSQ